MVCAEGKRFPSERSPVNGVPHGSLQHVGGCACVSVWVSVYAHILNAMTAKKCRAFVLFFMKTLESVVHLLLA